MFYFKIAFCLISLTITISNARLKEEFTWTHLDYDWTLNSSAIKQYIRENNVPMGVKRYKNKLFITVPRRSEGIPSTVNYVDLDKSDRHNVPLKPYPNWDLNLLTGSKPNDTNRLDTPFVSVYRAAIDPCDRLWFVDTGILEYRSGRQQVQQSVLVVIDLKTDKVIRRYTFKESDANGLGTISSVTVDVTKNTCDKAYAYITDILNYKLLVYSFQEHDAWKVNHNYLYLDPFEGEFFIGGHNFQWHDGVFSVVLGKTDRDGYRNAYFHSLIGVHEFSVSTRVLRNRTLATRGYHGNDFKVVGNRGALGQATNHQLHEKSGVFFINQVQKNGVYCWNIKRPLTPKRLYPVHRDNRKLVYPSDMHLDFQDNLWVINNKMPVFVYGKLNYTEVNFRVWTNNVQNLRKTTQCFV